MDIKNKVIIVTGASKGIGMATARLLAKRGARVALAARSKEILDRLSKELPDSFPIPTDMSDPESIDHMIDETLKHYGRIDILVNNAGQGMYGAVEHTVIDAYKYVIGLNVIGPLLAMKKVIPIMREQGAGMILNVGSLVSKAYFPFLGAYASTKYALNAISLTARTELEKDNIIVSVMHPGMTATDFGKNAIKMDATGITMESRRREGLPDPDSAEHVANRILLAIETGQAETYAHDRQ